MRGCYQQCHGCCVGKCDCLVVTVIDNERQQQCNDDTHCIHDRQRVGMEREWQCERVIHTHSQQHCVRDVHVINDEQRHIHAVCLYLHDSHAQPNRVGHTVCICEHLHECERERDRGLDAVRLEV